MAKNVILTLVAGLATLAASSFELHPPSFPTRTADGPAAVLSPGVVFEIEVMDHSQIDPEPQELVVSIEGRNISIPVLPEADRRSSGKMIFRGDRGERGEVVVVDDDNRTYYVMDETAIGSMNEQRSQVERAMQEALEQLTEEQREALEKARRQGGPTFPGMRQPRSQPEVKRTDEKARRQGYPCVKYVVLRDGRTARELWITDWEYIDGGDEAREAFAAMEAFFDALGTVLPGGEEGVGGLHPYEEMNFADGFPVVTREFDEWGELEEESTLRSARRHTLDPEEFEPPAGYKRRSMGPR